MPKSIAELLTEISTEVSGQDALIQSILTALDGKSAGGGDAVKTGSFTPATNTSALQRIEHGLGKIPTVFVLDSDAMSESTTLQINGWIINPSGDQIQLRTMSSYKVYTGYPLTDTNYCSPMTETEVLLGGTRGNLINFVGGVEYRWWAV